MPEEEKVKQENKNEQENPVLESEIILWSFFLLGIDTVCILIDITGIGMAIAPWFQSGATFINGIWFQKAKGNDNAMSFQRQLIKYLSNFAPFLPTLFIAFLFEVYMHNHPKSTIAKNASKLPNIKIKA